MSSSCDCLENKVQFTPSQTLRRKVSIVLLTRFPLTLYRKTGSRSLLATNRQTKCSPKIIPYFSKVKKVEGLSIVGDTPCLTSQFADTHSNN